MEQKWKENCVTFTFCFNTLFFSAYPKIKRYSDMLLCEEQTKLFAMPLIIFFSLITGVT